jgi:ketosteroid isomerase-like protein
MNNGKRNPKRRSATANEEIVYEYFRQIKNKDINGVLDLFADDAIIYEPFSNIQGGLRGKSAIRPFFDVVLMANDGLQHKIEFVKVQNDSNNGSKEDNNQVTALVTFERGGTVQGRYTFVLLGSKQEQEHYRYRDREKKIQTLHIEFIK